MTLKLHLGNVTFTVKVKKVHLTIQGRVQGVFFRVSAKEQADRLKLTGWVRNLPEGSVEVQVEGTEDKLDDFINWCYKGPPNASVTNVDLEYLQPSGDMTSFSIEYNSGREQ